MSTASKLFVGLAALYVAWLCMQAIHELGHVLAAWATGGRVVRVVLHPLELSRTDVSPNPAPLPVAWGGLMFGALAPLLAMLLLKRVSRHTQRQPYHYASFFAGFCLIANGAYIGAGAFDGIGDAGDLLRHGAQQWQLMTFGLAAVVAGLVVWHLALANHRANHAGQPSSAADP